MNHFEADHWKDYSFASNHFWGVGAPAAAPTVGGYDPDFQLDEVVVAIAQRREQNARASILVALAEAEDFT